jgi:hypothetical protein
VKQNIIAGNPQWSKAAPLMAAKKEREREGQRDREGEKGKGERESGGRGKRGSERETERERERNRRKSCCYYCSRYQDHHSSKGKITVN